MQRRMLILEDDQTLRKHLCTLFTRRGFEVSAVSTVADFLEPALKIPFDALLLDFCLPDGDGLQAWAKARRAQANAVAVLITANGTEEIANRAEELGIQALIHKPLDIPRLMSALGVTVGEA